MEEDEGEWQIVHRQFDEGPIFAFQNGTGIDRQRIVVAFTNRSTPRGLDPYDNILLWRSIGHPDREYGERRSWLTECVVSYREVSWYEDGREVYDYKRGITSDQAKRFVEEELDAMANECVGGVRN